MSQLIVCKNKNGIVLAADSKAVDFDTNGNLVAYQIKRLFQLTPKTAVLTGGAAAGEHMCRALKDFVQKERLEDIVDLYHAALPFLASQYDEFMRKACELLPLDPIHQIYFILAGYTSKAPEDPYKLFLLWTKKRLPRLDGDDISTAFTIPRLLRLEYRLNQGSLTNRSPESLMPAIRTELEKQAGIQDEVGGPFQYALIDSAGFRTAD